MIASTETSSELILDRFCGREIHPITEATWNIYRDHELGMMNLCLRLRAGRGSLLHDDTASLLAEPWWEIDVVESQLTPDLLTPGARFEVPIGYDESRRGHITNFYYCEHEDTENNIVEVVAVDGERIRWRLSGETIDVNFYDDSKPRTKLFVDTWFTRDPDSKRSMA